MTNWRAPGGFLIGLLVVLAISPMAQAQTSTDFFLHGTGPDNNPPTLFLNTTAPTAATAKFRDSTSINFNGGNLWKDIGTWPASASLTTGTLTALSDLHVWLGLKNSDDQGTQFDLRAEVFKNGVLMSSDLTRCISGIVRNANQAKEVTVAFGSVPATPFNGTSDTLSIKLSTRIGTNPDDTKCPGHNNAVGLRLYFDATSRNARFDATIATQQTPTITNFTPTEGPVGTTVTITGTNFDPVPGNNHVQFNGVTATVTAAAATSLTVTVPTGATTGLITVTTAAGTATSATNFTVLVPPTINSFMPANGRAGTTVTVTGAHFTGVSAVTFNGIPATSVIVENATTLTAVVPPTATTGPLAVTTTGGTGTSTGQFIVIPTQDMQLSALPATLTIPSLGQASFKVALTGSGGFTNLATLAVTGLPTGLTATFNAATLTAGQSTLLTVTTNGAVPAGTVPLTITATGLMNGTPTTRSSMVNVQVLATGATTFSGLVLDEEDKPVQGALVKIGTTQVTTDDAGNFLMQNPPVGANHVLFIDGGPASTPGKSLPVIPYKVTIVAGQANALSFVPHLHYQKTTGMVDISNSGVERFVTDPELPGFQMKIPAGATIIGWDGQPNTQVSIRKVALDRTPIPALPADHVGGSAYMYYFGKDGGGTPSEPIPITFPNELGAPPGAQVELWFYDEAPDGSRPNQMAQYGTGTVSATGSQIIPDIDPATGKAYGQPRFCCGFVWPAWVRAIWDFLASVVGGLATSLGGLFGGDPVDLATGIFVMQKTDLVVPGRVPVTLTRTYRTLGTNQGPFGIGTSHTYDVMLRQDGDLRRLLLPTGGRVAFPKHADGTFRNLTDPAYQGVVITDTGGAHVVRFTDGATWTFGSPTFGLSFLTAQSDRNGNTLTFTRTGSTGTLTAITDSVGRQIQFTYAGNRVTEMLDPIGRRVTYAYDTQGRLVSVIDPEGGVTRYTYDSSNRMTTITDARGITYLQNFYGPSSRVLRQIQADGSEYKFRYQLAGATSSGPGCTVVNPPTGGGVTAVTLPFVACPKEDSWENFQAGYTVTGGTVTATTVVDPRQNAKTTRFNASGYAVSTTDSLGQTTTTQRNATNQVVSSTDALGRVTKLEYDTAGNVKKITDPSNQNTQFEYHTIWNRVTRITDALNQITEFTYDNTNGNLLTVKDPLTHVTSIAYNSFGQPTSVQGPIATEPPTTFAYDTNGNLITTTDPLGNSTQRVYDEVSRLTSLTDPRGLQTQFRYDGLNRVTEIADARQGLTRFSYDPNGNLLTVTDAKNQTTTYTYDSMDRLATRKDALNRQESYQYDLAGNLGQFTDRKNQQTTFVYDALNRRTTATYPDSTTTFTYDPVGRLTKASDTAPDAGTIDFAYDVLDRLIQEVTGQGSVAYQYDVLGRRTQMVANGQQPVTYGYDAASRLTQVAQGGLAVGLGYDNANRRTSLNYPNGTSTSYTYDVASRLININHLGPSGVIEALTYQYDAAGNRTSLTRSNATASLLPAAVASATYDPANEQTSFAGATLTYDNNGNLTNDGVNTYQWDARNRLIGISGGVSGQFRYDALGRRTSKTINSVASQFLYDGNDIAAEIGGGAVGANYIRSLSIDEPFIRQASIGNEHYHTDALGSNLALSNAQGSSGTTYTYEPFGKTTVSGTSSNTFQYTGRESDGSYLSFYRARYFDPGRGRFISEDPLEFSAGDVNLYAYVSNAPLRFSDPLGLEKCSNDGGDGLPGSSFGDAAAQYWAAQSVDPSSSTAQRGIAAGMGGLAALWTPCTSGKTSVVLASGLGAGAYLGRPYWNYYPIGNPGYPSNWLTRGWGWSPPHMPGTQAAQRLALPPTNPGTAVRPVSPPWWQPVAGPRHIKPDNNQPGGGWEYKTGGIGF
ncbi:MAG: RHS repeat-associated core domain-containing protein [Nitrospira sp.]|nr:RHS repeat-associated core domain-containing protein [Nitrospira sp.]